jgi:hypothetical protein
MGNAGLLENQGAQVYTLLLAFQVFYPDDVRLPGTLYDDLVEQAEGEHEEE